MLYGQPEAIFRINAMLVADGVFSLFVACRVVGRLVGGAKQLAEPSNSLKFPKKSRARPASPRSRPTSPVNGAGGITGCFDDSEAPEWFQRLQNFFVHG